MTAPAIRRRPRWLLQVAAPVIAATLAASACSGSAGRTAPTRRGPRRGRHRLHRPGLGVVLDRLHRRTAAAAAAEARRAAEAKAAADAQAAAQAAAAAQPPRRRPRPGRKPRPKRPGRRPRRKPSGWPWSASSSGWPSWATARARPTAGSAAARPRRSWPSRRWRGSTPPGDVDAALIERLAAPQSGPAAGGGGPRIDVDLGRQVVTVSTAAGTRDLQRLHRQRRGPSTGATAPRAWPTRPPGSYSVLRRIEGMDEGPLGAMYRPLYFFDGWAVHGSSHVPAYPASHGCVRVSNADQDWIWENVPNGATVSVF